MTKTDFDPVQALKTKKQAADKSEHTHSEDTLGSYPPETRRALPMALLQARESVMSRFRPMLHAHGITEQQWRVIRVLSEEETLDATVLSERANIFASSLSRILKTLEKRGFVARQQSAEDARRAQIRLTESGYRTIDAIAPESLAIYAELEKDFGGHARVAELIRMLNELSDQHRSDDSSG